MSTRELEIYSINCLCESYRNRLFYSKLVSLGIRSEHFRDETYVLMFDTIGKIYKKDNCEKIDLSILKAVVTDEIQKTVQPTKISSAQMVLNDVCGKFASISTTDFSNHIETAAEKIKASYVKSMISEKMLEMSQEIANGDMATSSALKMMSEIQSEVVRGMDFKSKSSTVSEMKKEIIESITGDFDPPVDSGFPSLNNSLHGGLQPSYLIYVAGRPGMAKTQVLVNMAARAALKNKVMFMTYELPKPFIAKRLLASASDLTLSQLIGGPGSKDKLSPEQVQHLEECIDNFSKNIIIVDAMTMNVSESAAFVENAVRTQGVKAVYFDYVQIMRTHDNKIPEKESDIASISFVLRELASSCNIPVVAAAQLNREVEKRKDKRPKMSDLRSSGSLENDARVILGLYRDAYYNPLTDKQDILEISILKNTNGETCTFENMFNPTKCSIYELVNDDESEDYGDI